MITFPHKGHCHISLPRRPVGVGTIRTGHRRQSGAGPGRSSWRAFMLENVVANPPCTDFSAAFDYGILAFRRKSYA